MAKLHFARGLPFLSLGTATLNLFTLSLTGSPLNLILAGMFGVLGALQFVQPVALYTGESLEMKNMLGMTMKTHPVPDAALIRFDGRTMHYDGKKLIGAFSGWIYRSDDWEELVAAVEARR